MLCPIHVDRQPDVAPMIDGAAREIARLRRANADKLRLRSKYDQTRMSVRQADARKATAATAQ